MKIPLYRHQKMSCTTYSRSSCPIINTLTAMDEDFRFLSSNTLHAAKDGHFVFQTFNTGSQEY